VSVKKPAKQANTKPETERVSHVLLAKQLPTQTVHALIVRMENTSPKPLQRRTDAKIGTRVLLVGTRRQCHPQHRTAHVMTAMQASIKYRACSQVKDVASVNKVEPFNQRTVTALRA